MKKNYLKIIAVVLLCWMAVEANAQMNHKWTIGVKGGWNWTNIDRSNMGRIDETYSPLGNSEYNFFAKFAFTDWLAIRADFGAITRSYRMDRNLQKEKEQQKSIFKRELTPEQIAEKEEERKTRKKEIVMIVIGTFISLILTQIFADILDSIQRSQNRHMSALMVLGNIESFAVSLEKQSEKMGRNDTVGRWLLAQPLAYLDTMSVEELDKLINEALNMNFINRDRTAEKIFESTIDTWDNMDNVAFIDNAGQCFSQMNSVEVFWNDWVKETKNIANEIAGNSDQYPGTSIPSKYMHNEEMRHRMARIHDWRCWKGYVADFMRYLNKQNMQVIGVSDKELDAFIKDLADITEKEQGGHEGRPKSTDYYTPQLNLDSLNTMPPILLQ